MNKEKPNLMKDRFYRCMSCGSIAPGTEINENGKIKCRQIILRNNRYVYCETEFYVADYNAFIWDEEHACFKKFLSAKHWW